MSALKKKTAGVTAGRIELEHHRFRIVAGVRDGMPQAIAYLGTRRVRAATAESVGDAVETLKGDLVSHIGQLRQSRVGATPTQAEFVEALSVLATELPEWTIAALRAHGRLPDAVTTFADLARRFDRTEATVSASYTRLGRRVGALLDFSPSPGGVDKRFAPLLTFAVVEVPGGDRPLQLRLRPEILAALVQLYDGVLAVSAGAPRQ